MDEAVECGGACRETPARFWLQPSRLFSVTFYGAIVWRLTFNYQPRRIASEHHGSNYPAALKNGRSSRVRGSLPRNSCTLLVTTFATVFSNFLWCDCLAFDFQFSWGQQFPTQTDEVSNLLPKPMRSTICYPNC